MSPATSGSKKIATLALFDIDTLTNRRIILLGAEEIIDSKSQR